MPVSQWAPALRPGRIALTRRCRSAILKAQTPTHTSLDWGYTVGCEQSHPGRQSGFGSGSPQHARRAARGQLPARDLAPVDGAGRPAPGRRPSGIRSSPGGKLADICERYLQKESRSTSRGASRRAPGRTRTASRRATRPRSSARRCRCSDAPASGTASRASTRRRGEALRTTAISRLRPARSDDDLPF